MAMQPWLIPPGQQQKGIGSQLAGKAAGKIAADQVAKLGLQAAGTAVGGPIGGAVGSAASELAGPLASQIVSGLFKNGGKAKKSQSIWGQISDKVKSDFARRKQLFGKGQQYKPKYRNIGGMTPGPLGFSDMIIAGKGKDVSSVKIKKSMGDMGEEVELNYHPPLAAKPKGE